MKKPSEYEIITYKGRQIDEAKGGDYCGSCSIEQHCSQVRDPESWVHSSVKVWEKLGVSSFTTLKAVGELNDKAFLAWIHERLEHVHGENELFDYMHKLRAIIKATPEDKITPNMGSGNSLKDVYEGLSDDS